MMLVTKDYVQYIAQVKFVGINMVVKYTSLFKLGHE